MILDDIVKAKKIRLEEQKNVIGEEQMKQMALECGRNSTSLYGALSKSGLSIIGEFKQASPSHGIMNSQVNLEDRIRMYNASVDAISVLTEEDYFKGSKDYLVKIREMTALPILRKDFIIDEYQVYEAKVIGADAILLIAAILSDAEFLKLYRLAGQLGLDVLCEVHDRAEMQRMLEFGVRIIGINNRNLKTFEVSLDTTKELAKMVPQGTILVSESGITKDEDVRVLKESNVHAFLIGTALMESENPEAVAAGWKEIYNQ